METYEEQAKQENRRTDAKIGRIGKVIELYKESIDELNKNKGYEELDNIKNSLEDKIEIYEKTIKNMKRENNERMEDAKKRDLEIRRIREEQQ